MKTTAFSLLLAAGVATAIPLKTRASGVQGFDISGYQGDVDFSGAYDSGARFVMIKVRASSLRPVRLLLMLIGSGDGGYHLHR